ncbi:MAG: hypothetical protein U0V56_10585 [Actinomycetota bacterium]
MIRAVREMRGVRGVHLMGMGGADVLVRTASESGLLGERRPQAEGVS